MLLQVRVSQPQHNWNLELDSSLLGDWPVRCRMFSSIPDLYLLNAGGTPHSPPHQQLSQPNMSPDTVNLPLAGRIAQGGKTPLGLNQKYSFIKTFCLQHECFILKCIYKVSLLSFLMSLRSQNVDSARTSHQRRLSQQDWTKRHIMKIPGCKSMHLGTKTSFHSHPKTRTGPHDTGVMNEKKTPMKAKYPLSPLSP